MGLSIGKFSKIPVELHPWFQKLILVNLVLLAELLNGSTSYIASTPGSLIFDL